MSGKNYKGRNLRGLSFKGVNLVEADFSGACIEGTDFTDANLRNAIFFDVRAGVRKRWQNAAYFLTALLGSGLGFASTRFSAQIVGLKDIPIGSSNVTDLCESAQLVSTPSMSTLSGIFSVSLVVFFLIRSKHKGIFNSFLLASGIATLCVVAGVFSVIGSEPTVGELAVEAIINIMAAIFASIISVLLFITSILIAGRRADLPAIPFSVIGVISIVSFARGSIRASLCGDNELPGTILAIGIGILITYLCCDLSRACLQEIVNESEIDGEEIGLNKHSYIRNSSITLASQFGTCFLGANLTCSNFSKAKIKNTNFRNAELAYSRWDGAKNIDYADFENTVLNIKKTRDLLRTRDGRGKKYSGIDLHETDLTGINFEYAQLKGTNLEKAHLSKTNLKYANLKLARLPGAVLDGACLTNAIIEGWAYNRSTSFMEVDCDRVYLREDPDPNSPYGREPAPAVDTFEKGDFTKLFELAKNTFSLILRKGVDPFSLDAALRAISISHDGVRLRGIEDKHDGFIVITLDVQENTDKAGLQKEFHQIYQKSLRELEDKIGESIDNSHQKIIAKYDEEIRSKDFAIRELTGMLKSSSQGNITLLFSGENISDLSEGFTIWATISVKGHGEIKVPGSLPASSELSGVYKEWQNLFRAIYAAGNRINFINEESQEPFLSNLSKNKLRSLGEQTQQLFNQWLQSNSFREIDQTLREEFLPQDEVNISIVTENLMLRSLPWESWNYHTKYRRSGFALACSGKFHQKKIEANRSKMRILIVLGNSQGIDVKKDEEIFKEMLKGKAELKFLSEPKRSDLNEALWDDKGFDILAFSGHGPSHENGSILINQDDELNTQEIIHALSIAVERGLQLAIFNSCNGLGLSQTLSSVNIPYFVLMKESISDKVAQEFLKKFLGELVKNQSIHLSMRTAKQFLQGQVEDEFLYASWLPTLFSNSKSAHFQWRS